MQEMPKTRRPLWPWSALILLILLVASLPRLHGLGDQSLWEDELFSADITLNRTLLPRHGVPFFERINLREVGSDESFWTIKAADQSPPFYELLSKVSVVFLGDGETSIRAVSAIAALVFLAWLGWRACKHRGTTLGMVYLSTLAMCAASGFMTFYAREARAYSLGAALAGMMAVLFLERALRGWRQAPLPGWPETGLLVAAAMTHYNLTVLSALILAAYSAEAWRRRDWPALLRMSLVPLALLAWLALSYHSFLLASQGYFGWVKLGYGEAFWVGLRGIGRDALGWPTTAVVIMALITAVLFTMHPRLRGQAESSDAAAVPREKWMNATLALFLLAASYFMAVTLIMKESGIFHLRHYLFLLPIIHVLIAIAISRIWKNMHWLGWLFLIAGTLTQWPRLEYYQSIQRSDYRAAASIAFDHLSDGDVVLTSFMLNPSGHEYYLKRKTPKKLIRQPYHGLGQLTQVCEAVRGRPRFAFIRIHTLSELSDGLKQACGGEYQIRRFESYRIDTEIWEQRQ